MKPRILKNSILSAVMLLIGINIVFSFLRGKWDLTDDNRFTLTQASIDILHKLRQPLNITVLMDGSIKASDKNFVKSIESIIMDFQAEANGNIEYEFINPFTIQESDTARMLRLDSLRQMGLKPYTLRAQEESVFEQRQSVVIPGAIIQLGTQQRVINFFDGLRVAGEEDLFSRAAASFEYLLMSAIEQLIEPGKNKLYFSSSHGEPMDMRMVDFFQTVAQQYEVDTLNLSSSPSVPKDADMLMIFFPSSAYTEEEKMKIDYFVMQGGKVIFWLNNVALDDRNIQQNGGLLFIPTKTGLEDMLFAYGCRLESSLLKDVQCATMSMVVGDVGDKPQIEPVNWAYYPLLNPNQEHLISKNLDPVYAKYSNWISAVGDVSSVKKTVLLSSSERSQTVALPAYVTLAEARQMDPILFTKSRLPVAYLLEGNFNSLYFNRLLPESRKTMDDVLGGTWKSSSPHTNILVVANPQIIINEVQSNGMINPMGFSQDMNFTFANKSFLLNSLQYVCDPKGLIAARSKDFTLQVLSRERILTEASFWRIINLVVPLMILLLIGLGVRIARLR